MTFPKVAHNLLYITKALAELKPLNLINILAIF